MSVICFFKQKTAYEMRISDWSSDVCSSDLTSRRLGGLGCRLASRRRRSGRSSRGTVQGIRCVCPAGHGTARIRYRVCPAICPAQLVPHPWPNAAFSPLLSCSVPLRPALASRVCLVGGVYKTPPRDSGTGRRGVPSRVICHWRSEEHTSELQSLMRISYAVFCLKKKNKQQT